MAAHRIKSIDVQIFGNDAGIEVKGEFMDEKFSLDRIDVVQRNMGIELTVVARFDNNKPASDTDPFKKNLCITGLKPGVYYVRVDNNNNWVKWFKIVSEIVQPIDLHLQNAKNNYC